VQGNDDRLCSRPLFWPKDINRALDNRAHAQAGTSDQKNTYGRIDPMSRSAVTSIGSAANSALRKSICTPRSSRSTPRSASREINFNRRRGAQAGRPFPLY